MISLAGYHLQPQPIYQSHRSLVYRGKQNSNNHPLIFKLLNEDYPDAKAMTSFQNEYQLLSELDSQYVVKPHALEHYNNSLVLITEDFGAHPLSQTILQSPLDIQQFIQLAIKISHCLLSIHDRQVIHKDIAPANIIWNQAIDQVKLIDFGISVRLSPHAKNTAINPDKLEGTLSYIAPEQTGRTNQSISYQSDLYALGITFYELITGQRPFQTDDPIEMVHCQIAKQAIPVHEIRPDIPIAISHIIQKLMEKIPQDRYQSAAGLISDLEQCLPHWDQIDFELTLGQQDLSTHLQLSSHCYGRETDYQILLNHFNLVQSGLSQLILIAGYSGIGKSSFVELIRKPIQEQNGFFIQGKFDQLQRDIPYASIITALQMLIRQLLQLPQQKIIFWQQKLLANLKHNGQIMIEIIPELELIIGTQPAISQLPPIESKNRFNIVFQSFINTFSSKQQPLVIFLDDLQWADTPSLKLLELTLTDINNQYLFVIGAYRDNEVDAAHPLQKMLQTIQQSHTTKQITTLTLTPLKLDDIQQLIADSLHCEIDKTTELAKLCLEKTEGNPFFVKQLLQELYDQQLIRFNLKQRQWQWYMPEINHIQISDNVVDLMVNKISQLPQLSQQCLQVAACIGNTFNLDYLTNLLQHLTTDIEDIMLDLTSKGLCQKTNSDYIKYQFSHDRVQQAAYSLLNEQQKQQIHLDIGHLILKTMDEKQQNNHLFTLTAHLNSAKALINKPEEIKQLIQLNLNASKKAKLSSAYQEGYHHTQIALQLISDDYWQLDYPLILDLYISAIELAYLSSDFDTMAVLIKSALENTTSLLDKIQIYEIQIRAAIAQIKLHEAINIALYILKMLEITLPEKPNKTHVLLHLANTERQLLNQSIPKLATLPLMHDDHQLAAMRILAMTLSAAYQAVPDLFPIMLCQMVQLSIKHGNTVSSSFSYAAYGLIQCGLLQRIQTGYAFAELAKQCSEQNTDKEFECRTLFSVYAFIHAWKHPLSSTLTKWLDNYQIGMETGDLEYGSYCINFHASDSLWSGQPLKEIQQTIINHYPRLQQLKQSRQTHWYECTWQLVENLLQEEDSKQYILIGEQFHEQTVLPKLISNNDGYGVSLYYIYKLYLSYLFRAFSHARVSANQAKPYMEAQLSMQASGIYCFYDALLSCAELPTLPIIQRQSVKLKIQRQRWQLKHWARHAPENYQHKWHLLSAELANVKGCLLTAREHYDKAIELAKNHRFIHEEALANELAARHYLKHHSTKIARSYLLDAYTLYQHWGANAKAKHLLEQYPELLTRHQEHAGTPYTTTTMTESGDTELDLLTIIKYSQTLSGEIVLSELLEKIMIIMLENAGAERGYWITPKDNEFSIDAEGHIEHNQLKANYIHNNESFSYEFPLSIINYIANANNSIILDNAYEDKVFSEDSYIKNNQIKSILSFPIIVQGRLIAILYLENNLTTSAFNEQRLETLQLISAQISISVENAHLYDNLEQKVAERTELLTQAYDNLKQSQEQLVQSEKMASLGQLVAGVAHEINTPIGIGLTAASQFIINIDNVNKLLADNALTKSELTKFLTNTESISQILINNLQRTSDLITSFKQVSADQSSQEKRLFEIKAYVQHILLTLDPQIKHTPHHIQLKCDEEIELNSYPGPLFQVITNLLMNALTHAYPNDEQGAIVIEVQPDGNHVQIDIIDDGIGISDDQIKQIFDPFFSTHSTGSNTGLGLHIVYNLINQILNGQITCQSTLTQGTKFTIKMPIEV